MERLSQVTSKTARNMVLECTNGQMALLSKVGTLMTRNKDMESSVAVITRSFKANGETVNDREEAS